jgi:hypothetical protein
MSNKRAISVDQILKMKFAKMNFTGEWLAHIGIPQSSGVWIIWGNSGNGKTFYSLMLAKYLTIFFKVLYNSLEEGARMTMQRAVILNNMKEVARRFSILHKESITDLAIRLRKPKSPQVVFIDSFQYAGLSKKEYLAFKEEFSHKTLIFISHAEGKEPAGKVAKFVRYDADVKVRLEGYKAFVTSRYGGGKVMVISEEKANNYWGEVKK